MRAAWIVAVLAALAVAAHATELEDKVAKTIDEFKAMMPTGRADLNIPVLEPVSIKNLPLNIVASPLNAKVVASGVQVAGASSFQLTQLSQVGDSSQVDVAVEVPGVDVTGDYDINGKVKVGFLHVNLNGQGPLRISVKGIKGAGSADILSRDDGSIHLNDMKINSWSYDSLSIDLENLFDGGVMGKTVNKLINKLVPTFASANYAKLTALLESVAKKYINKYLDGVGVNGHMLTAPEAQAVDWIVTEEVQDILNQLAVAVYPDDEPYDLETTVRALSEDFRVAMKEGREDLSIAAMDPAVFSELAVHFHKWLLDGQVVASNVQVSGASDFELTKVTALDDTKVVIDYEVPAVSLTAEYALDAKVNVGVTKLHSVRNGALEMTARGIKGAATAVLGVDVDGQLRLDSFQVDSWTYAGLSVRVDNQNDAGFIKKQVNTLIGKLVPSLLVKPHAKELTAWVSSRAQKVLGRFLDGAAGRIVIAGLDGRAAELLEQLRAIMQTGSEQYGMPVLDPFTLDALPISFEDKFISASVIAKDFHVAGTSAYTISEISQLPNSNEVSVVVEVPEIHGSSNFEASAALQWPKKEVTDSGSLTAQLKGLKVFATARLAENAEGSLLLRDLKITSWTYSKIQVEFANLMDSHVKILLNTAINTVLPTIINAEKDVINSWAEVTAKAVLDQYLAGVAQAALPAVHVKVVSAEARQMIMQLAALAA